MSHISAATWGWIGIGIALVSMFVSLRQQKKLSKKKASYTYGEGALTTNVSTTDPVPIIYGTVKTAGNMIYSRLSDDKKVLYKLVSVADGRIKGIRDLQFDDLDANSSKYEGVSYNYYYGDGVQEIDSRVIGDTQEDKAMLVGGLKYLAYVALQAKANENLSSSFNVTCLVDGSIVKIYENANDLTQYREEWTDNPAWCVLDFMTRYNGCGMSLDEIDVQSFIDGAKFFKEKNYTLNLALDEQRSRLEWIQYMLNCCRSLLIYRAGKYSLFVEKADEVVQSYTPNDIHDLSIWFSPLSEVPDIYRITYIDPKNEWVKVNAEASLSPDSYLRKQPMVETLELMGVTTFDQASRLAWFYLNQALTCQTYVSFKTDRRALNRTVGDVIEVTDYVTEFQKKKFRIIKIEDEQNESIKLTCREYNESIYSEQRGASDPVINVTELTDPQQTPPEIVYVGNEQDYYILPDKTVVSNIMLDVIYTDWTYNKSFNVSYRKKGSDKWLFGGTFDDGTYRAVIENMEIYETYIFRFQNMSKYGKFSAYTYSPEIYITGKNVAPNMPSNFHGEEVAGGFKLYWDAGEKDVDYYLLYLGSVSEEGKIAQVYGTSYYYPANVGEYTFYLVAVDTAGNRSTPARLLLEILCPSDVNGFDCVQNERNIEFHWNLVEGASYYVLKEGENWEYGNTLATSSGHFFSYPYAQATSTTFWMKAYTEYGVPSVNPAYCQLSVASIPNRNMILEYDAVADGWSGKKYNMHVNAGGIQLDAGKVYGDYIYPIELDQEYCARNWTEKTIKPVNAELELMWKDAHFTWASGNAKRRTWFPLGIDDIYNSWTEIAVYNEASKEDVVERMSLNETLVSDSGKKPVGIVGTPTYGVGRFEKGLVLDGKCRPKWKNLPIDDAFSFSFNLYVPFDSVNNYSILTLRNDLGDYLWLHYREDDDMFVCTFSDGREYELKDFSGKGDYLYFMISQGSGYFTFVIYDVGYDSYVINRKKTSTMKRYTQVALYGDFNRE